MAEFKPIPVDDFATKKDEFVPVPVETPQDRFQPVPVQQSAEFFAAR